MYAARWCQLKGASRIIAVDRVPERLKFAEEKLGIETIDFSQHSDVTKRIYELVPRGLDVALDCGECLAKRFIDLFTYFTQTLRSYQELSMSLRQCSTKSKN